MQVLVTGAAGFIGTHLCNALYKSGYAVRAVTRKSGGVTSQNEFCEECVVEDIFSATNLGAELNNVDCVIHLASLTNDLGSGQKSSAMSFYSINTSGTLNIARQAAEKGVKRFIYLSSIKVNGERTRDNLPFSVNDKPLPVDTYGASKYEAEQGLLSLATETGLEVVIIRPPLVYGPGVKGNFLLLLKWLSLGYPMPLGSVHNKRSLVGIDNLLDLIITCIEHPLAVNQIFFVSDDADMSSTDLLCSLGEALEKPAFLFPVHSSLLHLGLSLIGKRGQAQRILGSLQVDISHTKELLNWAPVVCVDEELKKTADWYRFNRKK